MTNRFFEKYNSMSDKEYFKELVASVNESSDNTDFPEFPTEQVQKQFVGSAWEAALTEAFNTYTYLKSIVEQNDGVIGKQTKILDFGCGWGRFLRFFMKDVRPENIYGVDVDPVMIDFCGKAGLSGSFKTIDPLGSLEIPDESMDVVFSYSVFTHLAKDINLHWIREIKRVLKPGGFLFTTIEGSNFIKFLHDLNIGEPASEWKKSMNRLFQEAENINTRFQEGEFVYLATGGGEYRPSSQYGDAIIPRRWLEKYWYGLNICVHRDKGFLQDAYLLKKVHES